jgi:hypothetical protein
MMRLQHGVIRIDTSSNGGNLRMAVSAGSGLVT